MEPVKSIFDLKDEEIWFAIPEEDHQRILNTERHIGFEQGLKQGIKQGLEQVVEKNKKESAINCIKKDIPLEVISECIGISLEELNKLKEEIKTTQE